MNMPQVYMQIFFALYQEVELLRTELEVTHRHLEGKHEALRILQGQVFKNILIIIIIY